MENNRPRGHFFRLLCAGLLCLSANQASNAMEAPELLGLHLTTWHSAPGFCANTPGAYAKWANGFTVGAYKNSECEHYSVYAGWTWETEGSVRAAVTLGVVTGYKLAPVLPMIAPSLVIDLTPATALRMTYIPKLQSDGAHAINFAIQHSFQ